MPVTWEMRRASRAEGWRSPLTMRVMVEGWTPSSLASAEGVLPLSLR